MADKQSRGLDVCKTKTSALSVKIDVDVSEALTGLKAVERQAKKATQAIRELETYYGEDGKNFYVKWRQQGDDCTDIREVCMSDIPTKYLSRELAKREGVAAFIHEGETIVTLPVSLSTEELTKGVR